MWPTNFCDLPSEGPHIIMHQSKSIYISPLKDSRSHPIHTCFVMISSNALHFFTLMYLFVQRLRLISFVY